MADTKTDVFVGGLPGYRRRYEGVRCPRAARRGQEGGDRGGDPDHARRGRHGQPCARRRITADARASNGAPEWASSSASPRRRCLRSTALGAALGGLAGKFVDKRLETEMHDKIGENLPPGSAGIIAAFDDEQRLAVEQALPHALAKSIVQTDKKGARALKDGLAEAMQKFVPDRTELPIPSRTFGGTIGRSIDQSIRDWTIIPGAEGACRCAERAPDPHRRRRVRAARTRSAGRSRRRT